VSVRSFSLNSLTVFHALSSWHSAGSKHPDEADGGFFLTLLYLPDSMASRCMWIDCSSVFTEC